MLPWLHSFSITIVRFLVRYRGSYKRAMVCLGLGKSDISIRLDIYSHKVAWSKGNICYFFFGVFFIWVGWEEGVGGLKNIGYFFFERASFNISDFVIEQKNCHGCVKVEISIETVALVAKSGEETGPHEFQFQR